MYSNLFSPLEVGGKTLKNRITMAPLYLGYAGKGGSVSPMLLEHYKLMARSGAAMIVVENASVDHPAGSGSDRTIRADVDDALEGLANLAASIILTVLCSIFSPGLKSKLNCTGFGGSGGVLSPINV